MAMTRAEAAGYRARWARVTAAERAALRRLSMAERLERLAALMMSAPAFGGGRRLRAEDTAVRAKWARIRRSQRG